MLPTSPSDRSNQPVHPDHRDHRSLSLAQPSPRIDRSLLSASDAHILGQTLRTDSTRPNSSSDASSISHLNAIDPNTVSARVNSLTSSLAPTIDAFADGVHKLAMYCQTADRLAGNVLAVCAEKLEERDREGKRRAWAMGKVKEEEEKEEEEEEEEEKTKSEERRQDDNKGGVREQEGREGAERGGERNKQKKEQESQEDLTEVLRSLSRIER